MNLQHSSTRAVEVSDAHNESKTRLRGRWLFIARAGWVMLTLLILWLTAIAIPQANALLQAVCQPGALCINGWTPAQVSQIQQSGLSPGLLAAYQIGWDVGTALIYTALATLIFWRRSTDRMALFCAYMLVLFGSATYTGLLDIGLRTVASAWYWLVGGLELLAQVCVPTFFLLFPSGRFVPRWTRWGVLVFVLYEVWYVFLNASLGQLTGVSDLVFAALILSLVGLQIYRYRRVSTFRERQQTKWVVFGLVLALGGFALFLISATLFLIPVLMNLPLAAGFLFATTVTDGLFLFIPISIAIAILRSRLYDIDTIINKVLVYGLLTTLLALVYFGLIFALQYLLRGIINQQNDVAIVASTLAIAALFQPLRHRIQAIIDRRFYRRKYDAAKTLEAFSATLRNEVDLQQLQEKLIAVVKETMQPARVSLWLRPPTHPGTPWVPWRANAPVHSEDEERDER